MKLLSCAVRISTTCERYKTEPLHAKTKKDTDGDGERQHQQRQQRQTTTTENFRKLNQNYFNKKKIIKKPNRSFSTQLKQKQMNQKNSTESF